MGSICSVKGPEVIEKPKICLRYNTTDEISISPRLFVKENSNSFASVYCISQYPVGLGSVGEVWVCEHLRSRETRAVKIISKKNLTKEDIKKKTVLNEVNILKTLDHPCILKVFEYFEDANFYYIVMEYCTGGDLYDKLETIHRFNEEQAGKIMYQIFTALHYMHSKDIIHRDIKLENILIINEESLTVKLIDFNIAVLNEHKNLNEMTGTPNYMSPEVIRCEYTEKCDLWSCGVLMYLLISGEYPFDAELHDQLLANILKGNFSFKNPVWSTASSDSKNLISQLIQKEPCKRITAYSALKHPWILKSAQNNIDEKSVVKTFRRMKTLPKCSKIQEVFQTFIIAQVTKHDKEIIKLKQVFESLDKDKNGVISRSELITLLKNESSLEEANSSADRMMKVLDNDHSGGIDFTEYLRAAMNEKNLLSEENVRKAFFYFDKDRNGKIEEEELLEWLSEGAVIPPNIVEELMCQADVNGDGVIDIEEFQTVLLKRLEILE